ncbi:hypothetical protein PR202_ga16556 [Eleusine coracana subsp. coracana]|uniref:Uncharacterized protein n=1 Tax=Eleusine coracana subsp. coracana TaxID=191504 RepID=A0AAV5CLU9_ELECO|nr:hypothetical protein PR202_ga16556 [Eleusine coracana subsp. coracana]
MAKTCEFLAEASLTHCNPSSSSRFHAAAFVLEGESRAEDRGGTAVEGISIGGKETCVIFPTLSLAFDIGLCLQRAVSQEFLYLSPTATSTTSGGLPMYLFEVHRAITRSELKHNLVPLEVGEEYQLRRDLKGYVIYSVKEKIKQEFIGLPSSEIKRLRLSGVEEIQHQISLFDPDNADVLTAKILVVEDIDAATNRLPLSFRSKVYALKEGF